MLLKQLMMFIKIYNTGIKKRKKSVNGVWWYDSRYGSQQEIKSYSHWIVNMRKETQQK